MFQSRHCERRVDFEFIGCLNKGEGTKNVRSIYEA